MILYILILFGMYMVFGWMIVVGCNMDKLTKNPLWKPFIYLFWPLTICIVVVLMLYIGFIDWIKEVMDYYRKKRDRR